MLALKQASLAISLSELEKCDKIEGKQMEEVSEVRASYHQNQN